jgi:hypothetical protein
MDLYPREIDALGSTQKADVDIPAAASNLHQCVHFASRLIC